MNAGDVVGGLGRIVLDNSRYYLLGYRSDPASWSRRFVKIEVRLKRPGLAVRARRGFLPPDPKATVKVREADVKSGTSPALRAALSKPVPIGELPFRVFAAPFRAAGSNSSVLLAVEVDGASLRFQEREGRFNERVEVSIVAADERARVQGEDRQEFDLRLQPDTYQRVRRTGVRLLSRLTLPPGRYHIRVGAHETSGGATGTVAYDLEIPDYSRLPFGLSGLVLASPSADALVTANPDPALKEALGGSPTATRRFQTTETVTVYAEAYGTSRQAREIGFATTVHSAMDGRKIFEATDRREANPADRVNGFRTDVPLKGFAPGLYVLSVEATSTPGASARRDILFEVTGS